MVSATTGGGARVILRKLREIMAQGESAQERLNALVRMIAATVVADVCSIYLRRGEVYELFATEGLRADAVHRTRLKSGEGLVGLVGETGRPLNLADAPQHPKFSYRPETGEDPFNAFLGVPIIRSERVFGVLVVQNRVAKTYGEDEVEALQTIAMVLAEMVAAQGFGDLSGFQDLEARASRPERLIGKAFSEGLMIGTAVLHEPHAPLGRVIADDPDKELVRLDEALAYVRKQVAAMIDGDQGRISGVSREVLETFQLLALDRGWEMRLKDGIRSGLSAEASVERVRQEHRAKFQAAKDPYLRDRLHDFEDLDNRLLRALAKEDGPGDRKLPDDAVLIARDLGPAELLEYDASKLKGLALEEGGASSHAAIVARAIGIPMVGRLSGLLSRIEPGDSLILDGERGEAHLRPGPDLLSAYRHRLELRSERTLEFARLRDQPATTRDGRKVCLLLNAGLMLDVQHLADAGAEGIGLFRTEFQFMVSETLPRLESQRKLYRDVLEAAGERPVTFRTLDLGGDKVLPYMAAEREENPALGWRAVRIGLDRPGLLRYQLRALIAAAEGRWLRVMFPLVTTVAEFDAARALADRELAWAKKHGAQGPAKVEIGAMLESPALVYQIAHLAGRADFLSIGTNDLMQYFFAADRNNARMADRYDILSPPALHLLNDIRQAAAVAQMPLTICGEAAGRPLEAMALIALGFTQLSMPASGVGPVKRMARALDALHLQGELERWMDTPKSSIRSELSAFAEQQRVPL